MDVKFEDERIDLPQPGPTTLTLLVTNLGNLEDTYSAVIEGTTGPLQATLSDTRGEPAESIPIFHLPGLAAGIIVVNAEMLQAGEGTITVRIRSNSKPDEITATATATIIASVPSDNSPPTNLVLSRLAIVRDQPGAWAAEVRVTDPNQGQSHAFSFNDPRFRVVDGHLYLTPESSITAADGASLNLSVTATDSGNPPMALTKHFVMTILDRPTAQCAYQAYPNIYDVNVDGFVVPLDVLAIINHLNAVGAHELPMAMPGTVPPPFYDVSCDFFVTPNDALRVINRLNNVEGESASLMATDDVNARWPALYPGSQEARVTNLATTPRASSLIVAPRSSSPSGMPCNQSDPRWIVFGERETTSRTDASGEGDSDNLSNELVDDFWNRSCTDCEG